MISAGDFRNGVTLEIDGQVVQILEFQHVKPGKGAAFVRTKLKNVINGGVVERTFRPTEKFPQARIERVDMQYLYSDGDLFYFMNVENYEQIALNEETIGDALKFVKENEMVKVCSYNGNVFAIEPPLFVELEITETEPGFKGDTAQGASKPATVETGATVSVPLFVNQGDKIKICPFKIHRQAGCTPYLNRLPGGIAHQNISGNNILLCKYGIVQYYLYTAKIILHGKSQGFHILRIRIQKRKTLKPGPSF